MGKLHVAHPMETSKQCARLIVPQNPGHLPDLQGYDRLEEGKMGKARVGGGVG